jgi:DNA transposition AAA+ family ATPase
MLEASPGSVTRASPHHRESQNMTENLEKPKGKIDEVRDRVREHIQSRGVKQTTIATESGVGRTALSLFMEDKYGGDNEGLAKKLASWMDDLAVKDTMPRALVQGHDFVKTEAAGRIIASLMLARTSSDFVLIFGEPGVGKTVTLNAYQKGLANVWLATMSPDTSGKVPMLEELGLAVGLPLRGGAAAMRRQIVARLRNTNGLVIVDEAQHLDGKALDELRCIHDMAKVGMALCGNPQLKARADTLAQVNSRVGMKVRLGRPSMNDVRLLCAEFGVIGEDEVGFLHSIAQLPGGLRSIVKTIRSSLFSAIGKGAPITQSMLGIAWSELSLEDK